MKARTRTDTNTHTARETNKLAMYNTIRIQRTANTLAFCGWPLKVHNNTSNVVGGATGHGLTQQPLSYNLRASRKVLGCVLRYIVISEHIPATASDERAGLSHHASESV